MSDIFDTVFGFLDPFSSSDWEELLLVLVAILAGYLFLEKGIDKILDF
jgi:hypothetical protein